jgi:23S rRNA (cytidine1920-2'-O)/16S rRNA (cytidine1409-2'-O)-methyltransferase
MQSSDFSSTPTLAVMDVSFISATHIIPSLYTILGDDSDYVLLIKPQFEVGPSGIGKGGIVKDEKRRKSAVENVIAVAQACGFSHVGLIESPIKGGDGNIEFLAHFRKE